MSDSDWAQDKESRRSITGFIIVVFILIIKVMKLLKDKEMANGGRAPRMLCLDDYFMMEVEKTVKDPDSGKFHGFNLKSVKFFINHVILFNLKTWI